MELFLSGGEGEVAGARALPISSERSQTEVKVRAS